MYQKGGGGVDPRTLAHLARASRTHADASLPRQYLVSLFRDRVWYLPLTELKGHKDGVYAASFSTDGERILTASKDKTAWIWDAKTGKPVGEPLGHEGWVYAVSFSPDGQRIVTASADSTARIWDAEDEASGWENCLMRRMFVRPTLARMATELSPRLLTIWRWIWDAKTLRQIRKLRHKQNVNYAQLQRGRRSQLLPRVLTNGRGFGM